MTTPAPLPLAPTWRLWLLWGVGVAAYIVSVTNRSSLSAVGVDAAVRFDADASTLSMFAVIQLAVYGAGDGGLIDTLHHLTLPAISLAVLYIAYLSRITRGAVVGQLHAEHVDTARVRGIPRWRASRPSTRSRWSRARPDELRAGSR